MTKKNSYHGNKNAKKDGFSKKFRVRTYDKKNLDMFALMTPYERGMALEAYNVWLSSEHYDDTNFVDFVGEQCIGYDPKTRMIDNT